MKRTIYLISLVVITLFFTSCFDNFICIRGDGYIETERRRIAEFDQIENSTEFDIIYTKNDTSGISIDADRNIIDNIVTETSGSALEIKTIPRHACFNYTRRPVIEVSSPDLKNVTVSGSGNLLADIMEGNVVSVKLSGSGDIKANLISANDLSVLLSGSGSITLEDIGCINTDAFISGSGNIQLGGECDRNELKISGSGNIHADNYISRTASVMISGSGNVFAQILESLTGIISGSGNIYVTGNPEIDVTISGSGRVIRTN
jgi:hypothetical protein